MNKKSGPQGAAECVTDVLITFFDDICDLLVDRPTTKCNQSV